MFQAIEIANEIAKNASAADRVVGCAQAWPAERGRMGAGLST
jgi:hypothetical protein